MGSHDGDPISLEAETGLPQGYSASEARILLTLKAKTLPIVQTQGLENGSVGLRACLALAEAPVQFPAPEQSEQFTAACNSTTGEFSAPPSSGLSEHP